MPRNHAANMHLNSRSLSANTGFWLCWVLFFIYGYFNFYDDPSSLFYRPDKAFQPRYSQTRLNEADAYITELLNNNVKPVKNNLSIENPAAKNYLCLGIPSLGRSTAEFLPRTLAGLSDSITPEERQDIRIVVLLSNREAQSHFAYGTKWLDQLADEVLVYDPPEGEELLDLPSDIYHNITFNVREDGEFRHSDRVVNIRLDHSILVEHCRATKSQYFALMEDDVTASRDWFSRMREGLEYVESRSLPHTKDFMYMRLFYTELWMGWNGEEWPEYTRNILMVYGLTLAVLVLVRMKWRRISLVHSNNKVCVPVLTAQTVCMILGVYLPALIALFFLIWTNSHGALESVTSMETR